MGTFAFLPGIDRCCFFTRSLKVAVLFILFLSMLAGCTAVAMCLHPSCGDIFCPDSRGIVDGLNMVKWIFFTFTVLLLISCFVCFLAIYLQDFPHRSTAAEVHLAISLVWSFTALVFAFVQWLHYMLGELKCTNPSDFITVFLFIPCMIYFTCVINSYIGQDEDMK